MINLLQKFFASTLYVQVFVDRFELKHIETAEKKIIRSEKPFSHKRTLLGDFMVAEEALRRGIKSMDFVKGMFAVSPMALIHPRENIDGGLSQVEERAFHELMLGAGARKVKVWTGAELRDEEIKEKLR
jgi:rod shape-determining protein MreB and related proteins